METAPVSRKFFKAYGSPHPIKESNHALDSKQTVLPKQPETKWLKDKSHRSLFPAMCRPTATDTLHPQAWLEPTTSTESLSLLLFQQLPFFSLPRKPENFQALQFPPNEASREQPLQKLRFLPQEIIDNQGHLSRCSFMIYPVI